MPMYKWKYPKIFYIHNTNKWISFVQDAKTLRKELDIPVDGGLWNKNAVFSNIQIRFNGTHGANKYKLNPKDKIYLFADTRKNTRWCFFDKEPGQSSQFAADDFILKRSCYFSTHYRCYTGKQPYTLLVESILVLYKFYFPDVTITLPQYEQGVEKVASILSKKKAMPFLLSIQ